MSKLIYENLKNIAKEKPIEQILNNPHAIFIEHERYLFARDDRLPESFVWQIYNAGPYHEWSGIALYNVFDHDAIEEEMILGLSASETPYHHLYTSGIDERGQSFEWISEELREMFDIAEMQADTAKMGFMEKIEYVTDKVTQFLKNAEMEEERENA